MIRKQAELPLESLSGKPRRRRLPPLLRRAWFRLNQTFRRRIAAFGLTPDHFTILRWLTENPEGLTQTQLACLMASDANTITATLSRMEECGLIARTANDIDKRTKHLFILLKGKQQFEEANEAAIKLQAEVLAVIPADQRANFLLNLERLANACDEAFKCSRKPIPANPSKTMEH